MGDADKPMPPVPGAMTNWPDDAKVFYLWERARGVSVFRAKKRTHDAYDTTTPANNSLTAWESRQAKEYLDAIRSRLKKDLSGLPYSEKFERISVLGNLVVTMLDSFEAEAEKDKPKHTVLTALAREIRPTLSEIHSQVEGEGLDDSQVVAVWEQVKRRRAQLMERLSADKADLLDTDKAN